MSGAVPSSVLPATIELTKRNSTKPPLSKAIPPPELPAELSVIVLFVEKTLDAKTPPPSPVALFPLTVLLVKTTVPAITPPPSELLAVLVPVPAALFPLTVLLVSTTLLPSAEIPPPSDD